MTIEELIECLTLLKEQARNSGANTFVFDIKIDSFNFVIDSAIEELQQKSKTKWIPVSERLPDDCKTVIASTDYGIYPEARYIKEYGWEWAYESGADYWEELEDVTAWMPLPELYKVRN